MPASTLKISLDLALSGNGAPPKPALAKALADAGAALEWLRGQQGELELLAVPQRTDDLKAAAKAAAAIKGFKTVAVLGIGGSSLGGQALRALAKNAVVEF